VLSLSDLLHYILNNSSITNVNLSKHATEMVRNLCKAGLPNFVRETFWYNLLDIKSTFTVEL